MDTLKYRSYSAGRPVHGPRPRLDELFPSEREAKEQREEAFLRISQIVIWVSVLYFGAHVVWLLVRQW